MVLTSHDRLGHTGRKTGLWLEEFAALYCVLKDTGPGRLSRACDISPSQGAPRLSPGAEEIGHRFQRHRGGRGRLTDVVAFLVEDMLKENGGRYSKAADGSRTR